MIRDWKQETVDAGHDFDFGLILNAKPCYCKNCGQDYSSTYDHNTAKFIPCILPEFDVLFDFPNEGLEPYTLSCDCGAASVGIKPGAPGHSSWCSVA